MPDASEGSAVHPWVVPLATPVTAFSLGLGRAGGDGRRVGRAHTRTDQAAGSLSEPRHCLLSLARMVCLMGRVVLNVTDQGPCARH